MITNNLEKAHKIVLDLINDFEININHYLDPGYKEQAVREDFINKFWVALGWDVYHETQKNPFLQEVKIEKAQLQEGSRAKKSADYAFYLTPNFKKEVFFVEAKKPSRTLRQNKQDYFQTAKYGWNAGTGVSILTDFEEFVIIDCRYKPDLDTILTNEIKYYYFNEFKDINIFSKIYWVFSHEAVEAGNLVTYIDKLVKPKGTDKQLRLFGDKYLPIDQGFLMYIDKIRYEIALAFHQNNPLLDNYQLTEATQRTIDRLVFILFLEDKLIETESIIYNIGINQNPWEKFIADTKQLDIKYNGVVFKNNFIDTKEFKGADELIFRKICQNLDHNTSPYNFNYFPIHILGNIYENFLGKTIIINPPAQKGGRNNLTIDLKPEVRKAGGVFYTPKYIVDYIVGQTIGKFVNSKSPIEIAELSFADISCGSGSFLIGVFEYLLDYHNIFYNNNPEMAEMAGCFYDTENKKWLQTIKQKQQILLNNVFGVDIDGQATEVTQLSLFLKMLEDENMVTAHNMHTVYKEKILPDLSNNIKCGNSLVGYEIMDSLFDKDNRYIQYKVNPFDLEEGFPKIFNKNKKGFDAIIGNPPYLKEYTNKDAFDVVKKGKLASYYQGKMDLWYFFVCYGINILKPKGLLGYIIPNNWVSNSGASILRNKVINDTKIHQLIDFGSYMVFKDASIQTMIMILEKEKTIDDYNFKYQNYTINKEREEAITAELIGETNNLSKILHPTINRKANIDTFLKFDNDNDTAILDKILAAKNFELDGKKEVAQGIVPNPDILSKKSYEKYYFGNIEYHANEPIFVIPKSYLSNLTKTEKFFLKPLYEPMELSRYFLPENNKKEIIYLTKKNEEEGIDNLINHLQKYEAVMNERRETKSGQLKFYHLHWSRDEKFFKGEKIISVRKCDTPTFVYTKKPAYTMMSCNIIKTKRINLKYLTAILNSKLIKFWLSKKGKMQGNNFQIDKEPLLQIPIHQTKDKKVENRLIELVDKMIEAKIKAQDNKIDSDFRISIGTIANLEKEIDALVCGMYGVEIGEIV
jgi:adenine-specific DNA-methyltransferase